MSKTDLNNIQKKALCFFGENKFAKNFYWTGETLLSYHYLKHRYSVDLDFFSEELYHDDEYLLFIDDLKKTLEVKEIQYNIKHNRRIFSLEKDDETLKLEMVYFPFSSVKKRENLSEFGIRIDSLEDIMTNKALSTFQRYEVKDVYDLYYYLQQKDSQKIDFLIENVEKKFGVQIEKMILLSKIADLCENVDKLKPMLVDLTPDLQTRIKTFFQEQFNKKLKTLLL